MENDPKAVFDACVDRSVGVGALSLSQRYRNHLLHLLLLGESHQVAERVGTPGKDENEGGYVVCVNENLGVKEGRLLLPLRLACIGCSFSLVTSPRIWTSLLSCFLHG